MCLLSVLSLFSACLFISFLFFPPFPISTLTHCSSANMMEGILAVDQRSKQLVLGEGGARGCSGELGA